MWSELQLAACNLKRFCMLRFEVLAAVQMRMSFFWDVTSRHWVIGCRLFEAQCLSTFRPLEVGTQRCYIVYVMLLKNYRAECAWNIACWHACDWLWTELTCITSYAVEWRFPGLLALKMKSLLTFETSVTIYYSTRCNFQEDFSLSAVGISYLVCSSLGTE